MERVELFLVGSPQSPFAQGRLALLKKEKAHSGNGAGFSERVKRATRQSAPSLKEQRHGP